MALTARTYITVPYYTRVRRHVGVDGQILDRKWKYGRFAHAQWKIGNITLIYGRIAEFPRLKGNQGQGTRWWRPILDRKLRYSRFMHAHCAMHPAIIIGTVRSLWTWLWGRYHVPQNVFLVTSSVVGIIIKFITLSIVTDDVTSRLLFLVRWRNVIIRRRESRDSTLAHAALSSERRQSHKWI